MARTLEKVILGILVVAALGIGSILVTAINKNPSSFVSSIQVDDTEEVSEAQESLQLAALAKITEDDAKAIALNVVDTKKVGEITDVTIENEDGNAVYAVEFTKDGVETDVRIDINTGKIIKIERDSEDHDEEGDD